MTYQYPSSRDKATLYTTTVDGDKVTCDCPGYANRQDCWHVKDAKDGGKKSNKGA